MCAAPDQSVALPAGTDLTKETVLAGRVLADGSQPTIAYCRIGERSSHTWVVLRELLGHSDVKNYDGSWTEYGSLIGVPIELGTGGR